MNILRNIVEWIVYRYKVIGAPEYNSVLVDSFPERVANDMIYIVQEGTVPDTIIFKCPCRCKDTIYLNLLKDSWPYWKFYIDKKGITINPSVKRKVKCKSHFFVTKGKIEWCCDSDTES